MNQGQSETTTPFSTIFPQKLCLIHFHLSYRFSILHIVPYLGASSCSFKNCFKWIQTNLFVKRQPQARHLRRWPQASRSDCRGSNRGIKHTTSRPQLAVRILPRPPNIWHTLAGRPCRATWDFLRQALDSYSPRRTMMQSLINERLYLLHIDPGKFRKLTKGHELMILFF